MTTLTNFPMVSQETLETGDGKPSENKLYDCVAASIDASCRYLLGKPENSVFNPDHFKDTAYDDTWIGGTAAVKYIQFCASLGVHLYSVQGIPNKLVDLAHQYLLQGKPVIFTELDPYSTKPGMTHVCVFYADGPGYLIAMDPFPLPGVNSGHPVRRPDSEWINLLVANEIWITERISDMPAPLTITDSAVAAYFKQVDTNHWLCLKTGKTLQYGMLSYYQTCGASELHGMTDLGLILSNEIPIEKIDPSYAHLAGSGIVVVFYERGVLIYDPKHLVDNPPGAGSVYRAHLWGLPGQDPLIKDLKTEITQLKQIPQAPQMEADLKQIEAIAGKYKS